MSKDLGPMQLNTPGGYQSWTAEQKSQWLWNTLIGSTEHRPTRLPPLVLPFQTSTVKAARIVLDRGELDKALTRTSDVMEPGRPKIIHAHGSVALIRLDITDDSPFTGLLAPSASGTTKGLLRMSLVARVVGGAAYTPALALKLLIDGQPSADVLAMNHTVGQGRDFNLFSNEMTNDLSESHDELRTAQRVMSYLFHRISHQPRRMVSDHLGSIRPDGSTVESPQSPDRLIFSPTGHARDVFRGRPAEDFRLVLADLAPGTPLYTVDAVTDGERRTVGAVTMTSEFRSSDGGDRLFFRHVHDPADRRL